MCEEKLAGLENSLTIVTKQNRYPVSRTRKAKQTPHPLRIAGMFPYVELLHTQ